MFQESAHTQSKRTSLGLVGFFVLALAVAPPVEGVIYYGAVDRDDPRARGRAGATETFSS